MKKSKKQPQHLSALLIAATIIIMLFGACKKECYDCKELTIEELSITDKIMGVIVDGAWEVAITQDSAVNSAKLEYCACLEGKITAKLLPNGYLHIKVKSWGNYQKLRATITATALENIEGSGAANIRTYGNFSSLAKITLSGASIVNGLLGEGISAKIALSGASMLKGFIFNGNSIKAELSGSSKVIFDDVTLNNCTVDCSGASTFSGSGYATQANFTGSGASDIKTLNLESENLDIDLAGASEAQVTVNNTIKGRLTGASTLKYKGEANVSGVQISGGSKIIRLD